MSLIALQVEPVLLTAWGRILLFVGIFPAIWPYKLASIHEKLDAIGSKRSFSEVEPADWYVKWTRITGVAMVVLGVVFILL